MKMLIDRETFARQVASDPDLDCEARPNEGNPMKDRNIFAYTAPGADYPEFISINRKDGRIEVTVRSQGSGGDKMGLMVLPQDRLDELIYALRGARINPLRGSAEVQEPRTAAGSLD
jgi:hypothetical protein